MVQVLLGVLGREAAAVTVVLVLTGNHLAHLMLAAAVAESI